MASQTINIGGTTYTVISNSRYSGFNPSGTGISNVYLEGGTGTTQGAAGAGAFMRLSNSQVANNVIVNSSASINVGSGSSTATLNNVSVENNGFVQSFSGSTINGGEIKAGGVLSIQSGAIVKNMILDKGANLTIHISSTNFVNTSISNITLNQGAMISVIDDDGQTLNLTSQIIANKTTGQKTLYLNSDDGQSDNHQIAIGLNNASTYPDKASFRTYNQTDPWSQPWASSYQEIITCFLKGALIKTANAEKPVEDLQVGDEITIYVDNQPLIDTVSWVGHSTCTVRPHLHDDAAGYPVRILKDAIAHGVPFKDLLVTSEHCLFFEGHFIPARMLINNRTIFYDKSIRSYQYYHLETTHHSIIMANGVLTESYLDTGTRHHFTHDGNIVSFSSKHKTWEHDSAAPLGVTRAFVEPIYQRLVDRAHQLSCAQEPAAPSLTDDSNLHLQTQHGQDIYPKRRKGSWVIFDIPSHIHDVYILSRTGRPCDTIGPFVDDRRELGVAVGEVILFEEEATTNIDAHLHHRTLDGWHKHDHPDMRWTKGKAFLPLKKSPYQQIRLLAIEIREGGPYLNHAEECWHRTAS